MRILLEYIIFKILSSNAYITGREKGHKEELIVFCPLSYRKIPRIAFEQKPLFPLCDLCPFVLFVRNLSL